VVFLTTAVDETKIAAELGMQTGRRIPRDLEAAASNGTILGERGDQHVAACSHDSARLRDVSSAVCGVRQKMKDGAIVPEIDRDVGHRCIENVGPDPGDGGARDPDPLDAPAPTSMIRSLRSGATSSINSRDKRASDWNQLSWSGPFP